MRRFHLSIAYIFDAAYPVESEFGTQPYIHHWADMHGDIYDARTPCVGYVVLRAGSRMQNTAQKHLMLVAALLLLLQCSRTSNALDLVIYHTDRQESGPGWHDLKAVRSSLERAGHRV